MRHLIDFGDLTRAEWESLYQRCSDIMDHPADFMDACRGRVMASLFYEPSTRTNFSFQTAMLRVGGTVFGFADPKSTSTWTIISSNLTMDDVRERYSPQIASRLEGEYRSIPFFGEDIRLRRRSGM